MRSERCAQYCPPGFGDAVDTNGELIDGTWRTELRAVLNPISRSAHRNPTASATDVRDKFVTYLNNEGALPWQTQYVNRTN
jgi:hypothetical protein